MYWSCTCSIFEAGVLQCLTCFRTSHIPETALTNIISNFRLNSDEYGVSILVLLELSAEFDTIRHNILINRSETLIGISVCVLNWLRTYIEGRTFYINLGDHVSEKHDIRLGSLEVLLTMVEEKWLFALSLIKNAFLWSWQCWVRVGLERGGDIEKRLDTIICAYPNKEVC